MSQRAQCFREMSSAEGRVCLKKMEVRCARRRENSKSKTRRQSTSLSVRQDLALFSGQSTERGVVLAYVHHGQFHPAFLSASGDGQNHGCRSEAGYHGD